MGYHRPSRPLHAASDEPALKRSVARTATRNGGGIGPSPSHPAHDVKRNALKLRSCALLCVMCLQLLLLLSQLLLTRERLMSPTSEQFKPRAGCRWLRSSFALRLLSFFTCFFSSASRFTADRNFLRISTPQCIAPRPRLLLPRMIFCLLTHGLSHGF